MKYFYSQQGEDIYIYKNFINKISPDGIFLELGAMNGICYSNTKFFEDELKMSGILIEPTKQYFELIHNRPNCKCYNVAIHYKQEKIKFLGDGACAGIIDTMHPEFKNIWHKNSTEYFVDGCPISYLINESNIKYIDFLSIDVEGGEEIVLETMNFDIPIYIICIELDGHNIEKDERCRQILIKKGFTFKKRININEFWINENYYRKDLLFDKTKKLNIVSDINEIGHCYYLERHVAEDIKNILKN
jgi:FkbM family methyltransferase